MQTPASPSAPPSTALLAVDDFTVAVAGTILLRDVTFALQPGECLHLRGRSGLGKSTLLRALVGLHPREHGQVRLRGLPASAPMPLLRRRLLLLPQRAARLPGTIGDALGFAFGLRIDPRPLDRAAARALLDRVGLADLPLDRSSEGLSEGQLQRVALVRALLVAPQVLLLDEPSAALDAAARAQVAQALSAFLTAGGAAVLVSHDAAFFDTLRGLDPSACRTLDLHAFAPEAA